MREREKKKKKQEIEIFDKKFRSTRTILSIFGRNLMNLIYTLNLLLLTNVGVGNVFYVKVWNAQKLLQNSLFSIYETFFWILINALFISLLKDMSDISLINITPATRKVSIWFQSKVLTFPFFAIKNHCHLFLCTHLFRISFYLTPTHWICFELFLISVSNLFESNGTICFTRHF